MAACCQSTCFRQDWAAIGVQAMAIMGWNEPDNKGQSNLSPEQAAIYWCAPLSPCQVPPCRSVVVSTRYCCLALDGARVAWPEKVPAFDDLAQSFEPPLTLVGPGMTHYGVRTVALHGWTNSSGTCPMRVQRALPSWRSMTIYSGDSKQGIVARAMQRRLPKVRAQDLAAH